LVVVVVEVDLEVKQEGGQEVILLLFVLHQLVVEVEVLVDQAHLIELEQMVVLVEVETHHLIVDQEEQETHHL
jgi:hypothetical protein